MTLQAQNIKPNKGENVYEGSTGKNNMEKECYINVNNKGKIM